MKEKIIKVYEVEMSSEEYPKDVHKFHVIANSCSEAEKKGNSLIKKFDEEFKTPICHSIIFLLTIDAQ